MGASARRDFLVPLVSCLAAFLLISLSLPLLAGGGAGRAEAAAGSGWEVIDLPVHGMLHISAVDASTAYVAGANTLLKTVNGGANWSTIFSQENTHIFDIDAVDASNIWAVVLVMVRDDQGILVSKTLQVVKSVNGGGSWATAYAVDAPYIWDYMHMSISAVSPSIVWVALEKGQILRTADGGATWTTSDAGLFPSGVSYDSYACSVSAVDANVAWVVGGKMGWARSNPGGDPLSFPGPPYAFFLPYHPMIVETSDGGLTWAVKQQGTYDEECADVAASDALNAMAVGKDITYNPNPQMIMVKYYLIGTYPYYYWAVSGTSAVQTTHDGGFTWAPQLVNYPSGIRSVDMVDSTTAWVAGDNGAIFKTIDGGLSGYPQASGLSQEPGVSEAIYEIDAVDPSTAWAVAFTYTNSVVLRTTDGGDALPDVVSVSPRSGGTGSELTLSGCDFGDSRGSSSVSFGTVPATEYVSWSSTKIVVKVPAGVVGEVKVTITTTQGTSNGKPFTSTAPLPMPCGAGSGTAILMLGICLGLLSVAGSVRVRERRRIRP